MTSPVTPIAHAATVVLLRERPAGLQVLLTRRAAGMSFMGGFWVFPGGRMDPADLDPALASRIDAATATDAGSRMATADGGTVGADVARGLLAAACRETFEEAGVLLARPRDAESGWDAQRLARVAARRAAVAAGSGFAQLLDDEDLLLDVERLVYWAHWITPSFEKKRFDTRFFVLPVPEDQHASVDSGEATQHAWFTAEEIRSRAAAGEMTLAPPTEVTLQDIWRSHALHGGLERMLAAERIRHVPPILPRHRALDDRRLEIVLPWDESYGQAAGDGCRVLDQYPEYLRALPSRRQLPPLR